MQRSRAEIPEAGEDRGQQDRSVCQVLQLQLVLETLTKRLLGPVEDRKLSGFDGGASNDCRAGGAGLHEQECPFRSADFLRAMVPVDRADSTPSA